MGAEHLDLDRGLAITYRLVACLLLAVFALQPANAAAQEQVAVPAAQQTTSSDQAENTGDDFIRPRRFFQLFYEYATAPGTSNTVTTDTMKLRVDHPIDLAPQWTLGLRADLPYLAKNPISTDNPSGSYLYGFGDADFQAALLHQFDTRWAAGFGARLIAPTGGDILGSGKWQIMPGFGARYALSEVRPNSYLEPVVWYDFELCRRSFQEDDQQPADSADIQSQPSRPLVRHALSECRHKSELRPSGHRPDRAAVSSLRCQDRLQADRRLSAVARGRRADHQGLPRLRLQDRSQTQRVVLKPGRPFRKRNAGCASNGRSMSPPRSAGHGSPPMGRPSVESGEISQEIRIQAAKSLSNLRAAGQTSGLPPRAPEFGSDR